MVRGRAISKDPPQDNWRENYVNGPASEHLRPANNLVAGPKIVRSPRFGLLCVVLIASALSLFIALRTPAWEANDEPDHMMNIEQLVSGRWYRIEPNAGYAPHQPPLYYLVAAGMQKALGRDAFAVRPQQGDGIVENGQFGHAQPQERVDKRRLLPLRLLSIVFSALTILLTYRVARRLGADSWGGVAAAATVAFVPRYVFSASFVTNDGLATLLGAVATLLVVKLWLGDHLGRGARRSWQLPLALGLSIGALAATKLINLPMIAFVGLVGLWRLRRDPRLAVVLVLGAMAPSMPVFISNQLRYGDPIASKASVDYFRSWIPALVLQIHTADWLVKAVGNGFLTSFWYTSGWNQFRWKAVTYLPFWGVAVLGTLGNLRRRSGHGAVAVCVGIFFAAVSSVWVLAWNTTQFQARLAFPGLAAFGSVIALGWQRWKTPPWVSFVLPLLGLVGTLYAMNADILARF